MSEMLHIHDGEKHIGNVCVPANVLYQVAVHRRGAQKYEAIGKPTQSLKVALRQLAEVMAANRGRAYPQYNRGGVWFWEKDGWYEPVMIYEMRRL